MRKLYLLGSMLFAVCSVHANTNPVIENGTLAKIKAQLTRSEYFIYRENNAGTYQSANRRNSLLATYTGQEISISPCDPQQNWSFGLSVKGVAADGHPLYQAAAQASVKMNDGTVQFNHDNHYTVEYINNEDGIRQNFIIQQPAVKAHMLSVQLQTSEGWQTFQRSGTSLDFRHKQQRLSYNDLKVWDAKGTILPAHFSVHDNQVQIEVDVKTAVYPVTIDPIVLNGTPQNANTFVQSNQAGAVMGYKVSGAGDVNGDNYDDIMLRAPGYLHPSGKHDAIFVYYGSSRGINPNRSTILGPNLGGSQLFTGMAAGGDINDDGYDDVIAFSPYDNLNTQGGLAVFYGASAGLSTTPVIMYGNPSYGSFVGSLAIAKDLNGDGIDDVVVGSPGYTNGQTEEGAVTIIYGNGWGIENSPWTVIESDQAGFHLGTNVAGAGDINGDEYNDIVVAADNRILTYYGGLSGIEMTPASSMTLDIPLPYPQFSLAAGGDVNGDGHSDILIGDPLYFNAPNHYGAVFFYYGSTTGIDSVPVTTLEGDSASSFGNDVAFAGDVNNDGFSDIVVGARTQSKDNQAGEGMAFVYYGRSQGVNPVPASSIQSNQPGALMGFGVAGAGDVNGDGYGDVLVSAMAYANGQTAEGAGFVYHGGPALAGLLAAAAPETTAKIEMPVSSNVKVFPNPVVNNLSVQLQGVDNKIPTFVQIVDIQGTVVQTINAGNIESYQQSIDISRLTPGIYFVIIRNGSKVFREKIIKQ